VGLLPPLLASVDSDIFDDNRVLDGEFLDVLPGLAMHHKDELSRFDIAGDLATSLTKEHVLALGAVQGESSWSLFQVFQTE